MTTLKGHTGYDVTAVAFSPRASRFGRVRRIIASGGSDGTVKLWDAAAKSDAPIFHGHQRYLNCLAFSPDGKMIASEGSDGLVKLWDVRSRRVLATLPKHGDQVFRVVFSPDGRFLATRGSDQAVRLWELDGCPPKMEIRLAASFEGAAAGWISGLAFCPDGKTLAMTGRDKTVKLWDVASGHQVGVLNTRLNPLWIAFSPDGRTLAVSGWWEPVELWDVPSRRPVASLGRGTSVAFSPDGNTLGLGDAEAVKLWDLTTRRVRATLKGSAASRISTFAFSPDGKSLAAGCFDSTVKVWNLAMNQEVAVLEGHTGPISVVAFSPGGHTLASGGRDGTVRVWKAATFQDSDPLRVVAGSSSGCVTLQWQPLPWAIGYNIYRGALKASFGQFVKLNAEPVIGDSFADRGPGLANGRIQRYIVKPFFRDAAGTVREGPAANVRAASLATPPGWIGYSLNEAGSETYQGSPRWESGPARSGSVCFDEPGPTLRVGAPLAGLDTGRIRIQGSGKDIGESADGTYFLSRAVDGDFVLAAQALTRPSETHPWAKAGLMIREALEPAARNVFLFISAGGLGYQWRPAGGLSYQWRPAAGDVTESKDLVEQADLQLPVLLRLTRRGNMMTAEYSTDDGKSFQPADDPLSFQPPLPLKLYVGLAITSHDPNQISEAQFNGLEIRKH